MNSNEYYRKVFVALITWENHDLHTDIDDLDEEMNNVEHACSFTYGFHVNRIKIPNAASTAPPGYGTYEGWLSAKLESFYAEMERENEGRCLVILWYGGHGGKCGPEDNLLEWWSGPFQAQRVIGSRLPSSIRQIDTSLNWTDVWDEVRLGVDPDLDHLFILDCCAGDEYGGTGISNFLPPALLQPRAREVQRPTSYHVLVAADSDSEAAYSGHESVTVVATDQLRNAVYSRNDRSNPNGLTIKELHDMIINSGRCHHDPVRYEFGPLLGTSTLRWIRVPQIAISDEDPSDSDSNSDENELSHNRYE
ncbi:hypothetical protein BKA67DRAFT_295677 [Truncatella angustata]|uniref:Uncharacterized protein n=1 Tax=Truncatella angustata TaxID=152316 RepID=A0A9P8ZX12_9PEZI|nr:uncharacterized protein BKA67DRAFT_295677 [Truncatella angustata]KAH6652638.1 hypothetical protein BKA67DRAFT_295677 [Truncatella angustata]